MIWVIEASVAVRWFLKTESHPNADAVLERLVQQADSFAVPELFAFEVHAVLCRVHPDGASVFEACRMPLLEGGIYSQPMRPALSRRARCRTASHAASPIAGERTRVEQGPRPV